jgi:hypothetical protein
VVYHKNNGNRFFLSFEAKYPNPEIKKGKAGCFVVADFWKEIGGMSKTDALAQQSATTKQPALPFLISGLGYLASKLRKNLLPLFL